MNPSKHELITAVHQILCGSSRFLLYASIAASLADLDVRPLRAETVVASIHIDPRMTYLRTASSDVNALPSVPLELSAIGVAPGDWLILRGLGAFSYGTGQPID